MELTQKELNAIIRRAVGREIDAQVQQRATQTSNFGEDLLGMARGERRASENSGGHAFATILRGFAMSGGDANAAIRVAKEIGCGGDVTIAGAPDAVMQAHMRFDPVTKALSSGDVSGGGVMVAGDLANEVIELLRPMSAVRRMTPRIIDVPRGTKTFPKITQLQLLLIPNYSWRSVKRMVSLD